MTSDLAKFRMLTPGKYFCQYGMHAFEWSSSKSAEPLDCPDDHILKEVLWQALEADYKAKMAFLDKYQKGLNKMTHKELVQVLRELPSAEVS